LSQHGSTPYHDEIKAPQTPAVSEQTVADLMLRTPKTLPAEASVADVRVLLDSPRVQMVLLADGRRFRGAITELPEEADPDAAALPFAEPKPEALSPSDSAETAYDRAARNPHRRIIVLDEDETLLGLLCLNRGGTGFCGASRPQTRADAAEAG
jgi:hypothetical protein